MNIIINEEEFNKLKSLSIKPITFGSKLYGLDNDKSDTDLLYVYNTPEDWVEIIQNYNINHQFQYKDVENNIDHIFTSNEQFWKNLTNGDSTINTDIFLFSDYFNNLYPNKEDVLNIVRTYRIMKAYLGFAKRDFKKISEGNHKLIHGARCLYMTETLINNQLPTIEGIKNYIKEIKLSDVSTLIEKEIYLRYKITEMLNKKEINHYYFPNFIDNLLMKLLKSLNTIEFKY